MTAGRSEIQSGFINTLTMGSKLLTPGSMPTLATLKETLNPVTAGVSLNEAAVGLGVLVIAGTAIGLFKGYEAIEAHYKAEADQHELFERDCEHNVANFFLPLKKPSGSQRFFETVIDLLQNGQGNKGTLYRLANIHSSEPSETKPYAGYAIMNMASFSFVTQAHYAEGENETLDYARNGMDDFLQAAPQMLLRQLASTPTHTVSGTLFTGRLSPTEIRHLDLVRFMTMIFINISLSLKYPPDLSTPENIPLNDRAAEALCAKVTELIDKFLTPEETDAKFEYLKKLECKEEFLEFLKNLKQRIQKIQEGYQSKLLHALNMGAVVVASRELLKSVNESITHTLFLDVLHATNVNLLCLVEELASDFELVPDIWASVASMYQTKQISMILGLNHPPRTVIDLIGLFASYDAPGRSNLLARLKISAPELASSLDKLNLYFITPFDQHFVEINKNQSSNINQTSVKMIAPPFQKNAATSYLMSLIALIVESSPRVLEDALYEQLVRLNQMQSQDSEPVWFSLSIFDQLKFKEETRNKIKQMLKNQQGFIDALRTEIVLEKLLKTNKNLLMDHRVRATTKKAGMTLAQASQSWSGAVQDLNNYIDGGHDAVSNERRRRYFGHMLHESKGLKHRFDLLRLLIEDTIRVLDSPEFANALAGEMRSAVACIYASHDESQDDRDYIMRLLTASWSSGVPANTPPTGAALNPRLSMSVPLTNGESTLGDAATLLPVPNILPNSLDENLERSSVLKLQTLLFILKVVSAFLWIAGMLVLLSLRLGVPYLPIIAGLTGQPATGYAVSAGVGIAPGTLGFAATYFLKPKVTSAAAFDEETLAFASV